MPHGGPRPRLWCLNLDAEDELRRGAGYTPTRATLAAVAAARAGAMALLAPADQLLAELDAAGGHAGGAGARGAAPPAELEGGRFDGAAWCPTPRALARLRAVGANLPPAPSFDTLRRVNASRFPYDVLPPRLPGACVVHQRDDAQAWMAQRAPHAGAWLKRAYGAAGRGKLHVAEGPLSPRAHAFLTDAELALGVVLEPHVAISLEVSQHGWLGEDGSLRLGVPCVQQVARGRFLSVRVARPGELHGAEREALGDTIKRLALALRHAGYFGPFGVDAYRYADAQGRDRFNPCGELNARYTMGYAAGMAGTERSE